MKLPDFIKDKSTLLIVSCVLTIIFLINTFFMLFVYNKMESMEAIQRADLDKDLDDLNKTKRTDIIQLKNELNELEKVGTDSKPLPANK